MIARPRPHLTTNLHADRTAVTPNSRHWPGATAACRSEQFGGCRLTLDDCPGLVTARKHGPWFMGGKTAEPTQIYLISPEGGNRKLPVPDNLWPFDPQARDGWQGAPTWSPDGTQIAFGENGYHFPNAANLRHPCLRSPQSPTLNASRFERIVEGALVAGQTVLGGDNTRQREADALRLQNAEVVATRRRFHRR